MSSDIAAGVTPEMRMHREETFGPVAALYRVPDIEAAIDLANRNAYRQLLVTAVLERRR